MSAQLAKVGVDIDAQFANMVNTFKKCLLLNTQSSKHFICNAEFTDNIHNVDEWLHLCANAGSCKEKQWSSSKIMIFRPVVTICEEQSLAALLSTFSAYVILPFQGKPSRVPMI